jgi:hypothetical protein
VEKPFGWMKQIGGLRKVKLRGLAKARWMFVFGRAAYNILRIPKLRGRLRKHDNSPRCAETTARHRNKASLSPREIAVEPVIGSPTTSLSWLFRKLLVHELVEVRSTPTNVGPNTLSCALRLPVPLPRSWIFCPRGCR